MNTKAIIGLGVSLFLLPGAALAEQPQQKKQAQEQQAQEQQGEEEFQRGRMEDPGGEKQARETKIIQRATEVYKKLTEKQDPELQQSLKENTRCVAVFPNVSKAAVVIGGSTGDGIATCRTEDGWSKVTFLDLKSASLGVQLGASSTDMVMYFLSDQAEQKLEQGEIDLGAELSVAAGSADMSWKGDLAGRDVIALSSSKGFFAGASLEGTRLSPDKSRIKRFYEKEGLGQKDLLSNPADKQNQAVQSFLSLLPS